MDGVEEVEAKNPLKVIKTFAYTIGTMLVILANCSSGVGISRFSCASISAVFPSHHGSCVIYIEEGKYPLLVTEQRLSYECLTVS